MNVCDVEDRQLNIPRNKKVYLLQDGGVMLVATTRDNVSPSLVLELLRRVGGIIKV